ncbi:hypothetical protein RGQ29_001293 [Quercus rubra]|uniref:Uncharacterized protein n=1 Tax=Quercus rubra TaxID=3512 RepID=A0AAN7G6T9_QUERU|nr:hypothetical protein RGQ29_001293 [Quercus rubra]
MATLRFEQKNLSIRNKNFDGANVDGKENGLKKPVSNQRNRKALNDITNISSNIRIETKKNVPKEEGLSILEPCSTSKHQANVDGKVSGLKKAVTKKGDCKALNDSTNKLSNIRIEDKDVAQEKFLHDHSKCIESRQKSGMNSFDLDLVLPGHKHEHGHDSGCTTKHQESEKAKADPYNPCCDPEQVESREAGLSSTDQTSPPWSPSNSDSSVSTPFALEYEDVDFKLEDEDS